MIDYTLLVPASPKFGPLLNNLKNSYEKYRSSFANDMIIFGHDTRTSCYQSKMLDMLPMLEPLSSEFIVVVFSAQARSTSLKYLNGGVIISKRERYIEVLKDALDPHKYSQHEFLRNSDQVLYTRLYKDSLEREDNKVVIDCEARISLQMFRLERDKDYTLNDEKQLTFLETGNIPFFVHFNGDGKNQMHHFDIEYGK